jgi:hypothetical protein
VNFRLGKSRWLQELVTLRMATNDFGNIFIMKIELGNFEHPINNFTTLMVLLITAIGWWKAVF